MPCLACAQVRLYETVIPGGGDDAELLHRWNHDQPIWCVRLSAAKLQLLFAAGYDGCVTLYDVHSKARLLSICFSIENAAIPQFIWSLSLSRDATRLAVGRWSGHAHLYSVHLARIRWRVAVERWRAQYLPKKKPLKGNGVQMRVSTHQHSSIKMVSASAEQSFHGGTHGIAFVRPPPLGDRPYITELLCYESTDRIYGLHLTATAQHIAIAGRDKNVSVHVMPQADDDMPVCLWRAIANDHVYVVTLATDLSYCAYGGPDMSAYVRDGRTGQMLWTIPCHGAIWSVTMLEYGESSGFSTKLAIGGDFAEVNVFDLKTHRCDLRLLQGDMVHAVVLTKDL